MKFVLLVQQQQSHLLELEIVDNHVNFQIQLAKLSQINLIIV